MPKYDQSPPDATTHEQLLSVYGELMDAQALTAFFKFPSPRAFGRCASRAELPIPVFRIVGRSGWFARTRDVAQWLESVAGTSAVLGPAP